MPYYLIWFSVMGLHTSLDKLLQWSMRYYIGVQKFCPIPALYGELGLIDLSTHFKVEKLRYWKRLIRQLENNCKTNVLI